MEHNECSSFQLVLPVVPDEVGEQKKFHSETTRHLFQHVMDKIDVESCCV